MSVKSVAVAITSAMDVQKYAETPQVVAESGKDRYLGNVQENSFQFGATFNKGQWGYNVVPMANDRGERSDGGAKAEKGDSDKGDKNEGNGNGNKVGSDNHVEIHVERGAIEIRGCGLVRDK